MTIDAEPARTTTAARDRVRVKGLTAFLVITFGLGWGWEFLARLVLGWSLENPLVQAPAAFVPAIGALVVRSRVTREGFADAGSRPRLRGNGRYYLLAWLGPLAVAALAVAVGAAAGRWNPSAHGVRELASGLPVAVVPVVLLGLALVTTFAFWGEEFGWTGYLLVRILPGRPRWAALAAGLIAGIWHFPLAFLGYVRFGNLALGLAGWAAWIMCQEVVLAWLRRRTGSVWPACLAHAGNNMVLAPLTTALLAGPHGFSAEGVQIVVVIVLAAVAARPFVTEGAGPPP